MKLELKKKNKTSKGKRSLKKIFNIKQLYYFVYLAGVCAIIYIGYFIYENYYQTVTQAQEIADLRKEVAPESIDIERVNKVLEAIDSKATTTDSIIEQDIKNPFKPLDIPIAEEPIEATIEE